MKLGRASYVNLDVGAPNKRKVRQDQETIGSSSSQKWPPRGILVAASEQRALVIAYMMVEVLREPQVITTGLNSIRGGTRNPYSAMVVIQD